jgi:hypothetical protein
VSCVLVNLIGRRYGALRVVSFVGTESYRGRDGVHRTARWMLICPRGHLSYRNSQSLRKTGQKTRCIHCPWSARPSVTPATSPV